MFWFALGCTFSGLVLGWVAPSTVVLVITSFQIIAVLFGLWMGDVLAGIDVLIWCVAALFLHQGSYLAGVIAVAMRPTRKMASAPSFADQVDGDLLAMDGLVERIGSASPAALVDTEKLRDLIRRMRRTLRDDDTIETSRRKRQHGRG